MRNVFLILAINFCLVISAYAAPCYGTKMPEKKKIFLGVQIHSVFKRYQEHEAGKLSSLQEFLLLSYGLLDWLCVDLKGGTGNIKQHPLYGDEVRYATYLGGGYGFRIKLYEKEKTRCVFGFQHISIHPKSENIGTQKHKAVLDDWQFSLLGSYDLKKITPYLGTRWSRMGCIHWVDGVRDLVKSDLTKSIGFILGCDIPVAQNTWINLEANFFDSQAAAVSLNYQF